MINLLTYLNKEIYERVCRLMEEKKFYLNSSLKLADLSFALDVNGRHISNSIKVYSGQSFNTFVNRYRIEHVKRMLSQYPQKKLSAIALESGFSNETQFYRIFRQFEGMTPLEWLTQYHQQLNQKL